MVDRQSGLNRLGPLPPSALARGGFWLQRRSNATRCHPVVDRSCYSRSNSPGTTFEFTDGLYRAILIGQVWRPKPGLPGRVRSVETYSQSGSPTAERSSRSASASVPAGVRRSKYWRVGRPIRTRRPSERIPEPDRSVRPTTVPPRGCRRGSSFLYVRRVCVLQPRGCPSSVSRRFGRSGHLFATVQKEVSFPAVYRTRCDPSVERVVGAGRRTNSTGGFVTRIRGSGANESVPSVAVPTWPSQNNRRSRPSERDERTRFRDRFDSDIVLYQ